MAKLTMKQELEALRAEVERLKQSQTEAAEQEDGTEQADGADAPSESEVHGFPSAESLLEEAPEMVKDMGQQLKGLVAQLEEEYENLSPTMAVLIFAAGALFGRSLSSK